MGGRRTTHATRSLATLGMTPYRRSLSRPRRPNVMARRICAHWLSVGMAPAGATVTFDVDALFVMFVSSCGVAETVAVFASGPGLAGVTCRAIVALPPLAIVPRLQVTVVVPEQEPCDGVA